VARCFKWFVGNPAGKIAAIQLEHFMRRRVLPGLAALFCLMIGIAIWFNLSHGDGTVEKPSGPEVLWIFEAPRAGAIISTPCVDGDVVYIGAIRDAGFSPQGAVLALNRSTGKPIWTFDDDGNMSHMYSSPRVNERSLFIGEGMHANFASKLYCLDRRDGKKRWTFPTQSHIESTPCIAGNRVVFGAGNDGLYALDVETGKRLWQLDRPVHIDGTPAAHEGRVYAGSGFSRLLKETVVLCVDLESGREHWRIPVDQPTWGSPTVDGDRVCFGLGEGRLDRSVDKPAGAVLCLDARNGRQLWRRDLPDAVMSRTACDGKIFFATCRDGCCYALDGNTGEIAWRTPLGSAVVTSPALVDGRVYVTASGGRVACLDAASGAVTWTFDAAAHARVKARLHSSPVVARDEAGRRQIFFGAELETATGSIARLYALIE
jgi:outer membrane protein assembly factor BamB